MRTAAFVKVPIILKANEKFQLQFGMIDKFKTKITHHFS